MTESTHLLHFVLDLTSNLRFERHRSVLLKQIILPIINNFKTANVQVSFAAIYGSIGMGLHCKILGRYTTESGQQAFAHQIESLLNKEIDSLVDVGISGNDINGAFGVAALTEAIAGALGFFDFVGGDLALQRHIILLPTSVASEQICHIKTSIHDRYAKAPISDLISTLNNRSISLSMIGPDPTELSVLDHFLVFKCNATFAPPASSLQQLLASQAPKWVFRLSVHLLEDGPTLNSFTSLPASASLSNSSSSSSGPASPTVQRSLSDGELINRTLLHLSTLAMNDRMMALKNMLDPNSGSFPVHLRAQLTMAIKTHLQISSAEKIQAAPQQQQQQANISQNSQTASPLRRRPSQPSPCFWSGVVKFVEKQRTFQFRAQFLQVDNQPSPPRASLENWPGELALTGLLDTKKDSIQAGLSAGYAFRVLVNQADAPVASYLMTRMNHPSGPQSASSIGHLACLRVSQDVLVMLRVVSMEALQLVGYLIDRRYPKPTQPMSAPIQSQPQQQQPLQSSFQVNKSLPPRPISSALSSGMESLNLHGLQLPPSAPKVSAPRRASVVEMKPPAQKSQQQAQQQQFTVNRLQHQTSFPTRPIPAVQSAPAPVLTDPHAILQKMKAASTNKTEKQFSALPPRAQSNTEARAMEEATLDESFVDAWLN